MDLPASASSDAVRSIRRVDVHQHLWTKPLLDALAGREALPLVRRHEGLTILHSAAEQPYVIDVAAEAPARRAACVEEDGLDLALIAISSPIGIEALPREQALELIDAHLDGVARLPGRFAAWGPVALDRPDPGEVDERLRDGGCAGISVPAGALAGPDRLEAIGPVLERVASHRAPLFVHPGRAPGQPHAEAAFGEPLWWRALTDYVSQMQAAWLTFAGFGRRWHPELQVIFAMLAGGAPLQSERLSSRGGPPIELRDPGVFYETSSYGPAAVETLARRVGEQQLLYGSDRPVVEPVPTGRERLLQARAAELLAPRIGQRADLDAFEPAGASV
jgi:predicted TIM-barrel fold metal-dependent hydrolase